MFLITWRTPRQILVSYVQSIAKFVFPHLFLLFYTFNSWSYCQQIFRVVFLSETKNEIQLSCFTCTNIYREKKELLPKQESAEDLGMTCSSYFFCLLLCGAQTKFSYWEVEWGETQTWSFQIVCLFPFSIIKKRLLIKMNLKNQSLHVANLGQHYGNWLFLFLYAVDLSLKQNFPRFQKNV